MPKSADFEIRRNGRWERITVAEALAINEKRGRCNECGKPGKAHRVSRHGAQAAHFEHDTIESEVEPTEVGSGSTVLVVPVIGNGTVTEYQRSLTLGNRRTGKTGKKKGCSVN